jgi:hypothetical protein
VQCVTTAGADTGEARGPCGSIGTAFHAPARLAPVVLVLGIV